MFMCRYLAEPKNTKSSLFLRDLRYIFTIRPSSVSACVECRNGEGQVGENQLGREKQHSCPEVRVSICLDRRFFFLSLKIGTLIGNGASTCDAAQGCDPQWGKEAALLLSIRAVCQQSLHNIPAALTGPGTAKDHQEWRTQGRAESVPASEPCCEEL